MTASFVLSSSAQNFYLWTFRRVPAEIAQGNTLNAVAALSKSDAWAVGFQNDNNINDSRTLTLHWDGVNSRSIPEPKSGLYLHLAGAPTRERSHQRSRSICERCLGDRFLVLLHKLLT